MAAESIVDYVVTDHAKLELFRRGLSEQIIHAILFAPEERDTVRPGRVVLQSRLLMGELEEAMKVSYDKTTDTLSMILKDNTPIAESDEDKPGVILDYDAAGNLVSIEILDASKRVTETRKVEFQTTG